MRGWTVVFSRKRPWPSREEMAEVGKKIRAAVKAGKMTKEQGRVRMEAY